MVRGTSKGPSKSRGRAKVRDKVRARDKVRVGISDLNFQLCDLARCKSYG